MDQVDPATQDPDDISWLEPVSPIELARRLTMQARACTKCALGEGTTLITNKMDGSGPIPCDILVVGEAPGAEEDKNGKPFQGKSGKYLWDRIIEAGIDTNTVRATNAARCRPAENRTPTKDELATCRPYLMEEITQAQPKVILLLGNSALSMVPKVRTVTKERGQVLRWTHPDTGVVYPTVVALHPAAILRKREDEPIFKSDLALVKKVLEGGGNVEHPRNYRVVKTIEGVRKLRSRLMNSKELAVDIETRSFDWTSEPLMCVQFCTTPGETYIVPIHGQYLAKMWTPEEEKEVWKIIYDILSTGQERIGQNAKFDLKFLLREGSPVDNVQFDTLLAFHLINESLPLNLDFLAGYYLGWERWDQEVRAIVHKREITFDQIPNEILWKYAGHDPDATLQLKHIAEKMLEPKQRKLFDSTVMPLQRALTQMERCGVYIDLNKVEENSEEFKLRIDGVEAEIFTTIGKEIKLSSPQQVAEALFSPVEEGGLGLPSPGTTPKGAPSTRKDDLDELEKELRNRHDIPEVSRKVLSQVVQYRNLKHWKNTFIDGSDGEKGLKRHVKANSRIYPNYIQWGTDTGRLACREPNLQNIPRDSALRQMFSAPEGWYFAEADYSQIEARVIAHLSGAKALLEAMARGYDIHSNAVSVAYGIPYDEVAAAIAARDAKMIDLRNTAKFATHGLNYCRSIPSIAAEYGWSLAYTTEFVKKYFEGIPEQSEWMLGQMEKVANGDRIETPFGRVRHFPPDVGRHEQRQGVNFPVQSSAADILGGTTVRLLDLFEREGWWMTVVRMTMSLHDALFFEIRKDVIDEVRPAICEVMERPVPEFSDYRFPVEFQQGSAWESEDFVVTYKGK